MIRSFANLLISLNPTSGQRSWWIVWGAGMIVLIAWLATALPFIDLFTGSMVGIGKYGGKWRTTTMFAYGVEMSARTADYYFLVVLLGIAAVKIGWILINVGGSFARGYKYNYVPAMGILGGHWHR
ncbi:hypothetical protein A2304_03320 [Candidatus Uhrbacteria bacterium RIFOXYB2_FULL_57_15]|uniref:Uncharacterized protein n=1 Tax=Candidatus Uhrbacteria bacterium RIFOXYB2_FULL_57_15 TaxID=1802422 RepID=A0A1F7W8L3_9BACT|nr:MAG: hypothetical protein A2501_02480 [Candidatus Uhrbacteria bacterium RIFOXYC12_FULL_57_11]OGL99155.1 MAG: hypothetical protein A2304_03320 [Candidatus Uhrbacteria bacterium RIFOXYB2_FULL_57_15]